MDSDEDYLSSNADETVDSEEEEERDASTEDQQSDDSAQEGEGVADAEVQASQPHRRPRRKRTVTKWPEDKIVVTELTEVGMPKEAAAQARMRRLAGLIARQRISLVMSSFNVLSDEDKMGLFNDCVQPWLEFTEELKYIACKKMMQMVAKSWRTHKSHLVRCFVSKGLNAREKHTYIGEQDWEDFVTLKQGEHAKKESVRFKKLRERNKHDHHLGTGGYAGKLAEWEQEDRELADAAIDNPWDQFPGRSRNFMRARGRLVISEGEAEILWQTREAEILSQEIVKKQAEIESSGAILVRDKDVLTQALGQPEQTGRIRGLSSSFGWQFWPHCTGMYKKRKRSNYMDVEAIKEQMALEITEKVTEKITEKVTNDIMARLRAQGVNLSLLSNTPSSAGGKNISASASDAVCGVQLDRIGGISEQLVSRSPCKLVLVNREGYQVEVATGRVFPNNILLYSAPVAEGYVVVQIDSVYSEHEGHVLHPLPRNEIRTLGDALYKKIQWRREWVVVSNQTFSSISAEPATPGLAKSSVLVEPKVSPSLYDKADDSTVRNCASMAHVVGNKHNKLTNTKPATAPRLPPSSEQEVRDSPCTLVLINRKGYQVEVATGRVFPNSTELYSVPVEEGYVVVHISFVCPEHEGHVLLPRPSKEIRTLGDALYKRVQWKREWVLVSPRVSSISARPPSPGLAKSNRNVLVEPKVVPPSLKEKANDSTVQNCASRSHVVGNKENRLKNTKRPSTPRKAAKGDTKPVQKVVDMQKKQGHRPPKAAKGDTKLVQKLVDKQKQKGVVKQQAQHTKSSERPPVWFEVNPKFLFGQPMLPATELDEAGPGCATLHAYYMNACAQNRSTPVLAVVTSEHFLHESETLEFPVGFEDFFDLFTLDGLEMSILRCLTLCLVVEARDTSVPVGLLDPDALSVESIASSRDFSVQYLVKGLRKHAKKEYVMFPYNSGDHWIAVIIIPKWLKVLYIDSNRGRKTDLSVLKSVIDEAFANKSQTKATKRPKVAKLTHVPKTPCLQQPMDNTCGFYASFNMMLAMRQTNLDDSKELDFSSTPISLNDIREKIAVFIVEQILDQNGEFSCGRKEFDCSSTPISLNDIN